MTAEADARTADVARLEAERLRPVPLNPDATEPVDALFTRLLDLIAAECRQAGYLPGRWQAAGVKRRRPGRPLAPCGTRSAYRRHLRRYEPVDDACRIAATTYELEMRAARKAELERTPRT